MKTKNDFSDIRRNLSKRWYNLMSRVYDPNHPRFKDYGGRGVIVDVRWHNKENFIHDSQYLNGYCPHQILIPKRLYLDKDLLGNGLVYGPDTCCFLSIKESNVFKPTQMREFIATSPEGLKYVSDNQSEFARIHGLRQGTIAECLSGKINKHKGWTFILK